MQCVGTWLNAMLDPTVIADGLETLDTYLTGTFDTMTQDVTTDLTAYGVRCTPCLLILPLMLLASACTTTCASDAHASCRF